MPHVHEKIDFTVEVFVVHKNKVLLRKHDKHKIWLSIGGHIELNEDPIEAAIREVKEEVNLDVEIFDGLQKFHYSDETYKELIPPSFLNRHRISENHEHVTLTYFAKSYGDQVKQGNKEKSEKCRWFTMRELDDPGFGIIKRVLFYAKSAINTLGEPTSWSKGQNGRLEFSNSFHSISH
jgi:8-oxo-dGTP pyrophosphatase MutT (NUDIX family)